VRGGLRAAGAKFSTRGASTKTLFHFDRHLVIGILPVPKINAGCQLSDLSPLDSLWRVPTINSRAIMSARPGWFFACPRPAFSYPGGLVRRGKPLIGSGAKGGGIWAGKAGGAGDSGGAGPAMAW
jgi:hypothetical protein